MNINTFKKKEEMKLNAHMIELKINLYYFLKAVSYLPSLAFPGIIKVKSSVKGITIEDNNR